MNIGIDDEQVEKVIIEDINIRIDVEQVLNDLNIELNFSVQFMFYFFMSFVFILFYMFLFNVFFCGMSYVI